MPSATASGGKGLPVLRCIQQSGVTLNYIKLTPLRRQLAEAALATVPAIVIGGVKAITLAVRKTEDADFTFLKLRKLKCIYKEFEYKILGLNLDNRAWNIGFGIPALVELVKPWFHKSANTLSKEPRSNYHYYDIKNLMANGAGYAPAIVGQSEAELEK